ncbi:MAG TPA: MBL fold metallo-hydrolase [Acidimicrobiales bacterium]|nr:MBL fold metallo-hydrolase [Acidimicrobiales bacterium]
MRALKQEQEPARDEVVEVAPGILRMQLPINFTGLGHVNMYGLVDDRGIAVVDPGLPEGASWDAIGARLAAAGFGIGRVHTVVVTHSHPDHFGGAGRLAEEAGARIVTHDDFLIPWLVGGEPDLASLDDAFLQRRAPWSNEPISLSDEQRRAGSAFGGSGGFPPPVPTTRVGHGEEIELGARRWVALHTPGHTSDHLCLYDRETGVLLTGDHVLPSITPHIAGVGSSDDVLSDYLASLREVAKLDVTLALPAHGHPFSDVAGRVAAINEHHQRRLEDLRRIGLALGWAPVNEYARQLFSREHWGFMAQSETYAHLEHLRLRGDAVAKEVDGEVRFCFSEMNG